mmetsp:Transcript_5329/g.14806  ORF Transcript_5329/g.14806 Transcript_5329/m.14806 type:complete len:635 (-) Transcript_5329:268-2172(-)
MTGRMCSAMDHAVDIALSNVLGFCDGGLLRVLQSVSRSWRRTFCCVNANQNLFRAVCLQKWPWLKDTLLWSHCSDHFWHRYLGNWQLLCQDSNRANAVCSLEVTVPLDISEAKGCVQGPWVPFPGRDLHLRINAYPVGNRRMTTTHLSAYLEVQGPPQKKEWHAALDFTFVMQDPTESAHEVSWSSGPVRFLERKEGASGRLDWGCHELLPMDAITRDGQAKPSEVLIKAHVALQEALVEVVHLNWLGLHADDFGLCNFTGTFTPWHQGCRRVPGQPVRLMLPASTTKSELLRAVSRAVGRPTPRVWRFSRSLDAHGRLICNLPEAPRHLLASTSEEEDDDGNAIYALLTKWTLGESSGGTRQNFFRVLAEDCPMMASSSTPAFSTGLAYFARVFLKQYDSDGTLHFKTFIELPGTEDGQQLLPAVLDAVGEMQQTPGIQWCLVREGSPADWVEARAPAKLQRALKGALINGSGPVVNGDILVLSRYADVGRLAALYQSQYERRVADFVALYAQETEQVGSVSFASICRVMDRLNVDVWRLEQLMGSSGSCRSLLALMTSLPGLHPQFFCDACGTRELRGFRFNCLICSDFDLCSRCYYQQPDTLRSSDHHGRSHERSHRMVRVWPALPADCLS